MFEESREKLEIAKLLDKIKYCKEKNKIVNTTFLDSHIQEILKKKLCEIGYNNYMFHGGYDEAQYKVLIIYPEKFDVSFVEKNLEKIINVININLPNELVCKYKHKDYLSALMKLGLERERIGDILVRENGAYLLVLSENADYIKNALKQLTRFKKSKIKFDNIDLIKNYKIKFENVKILVPSMRLDSIVAELARTSRNKASELIESEKALLNYSYEYKISKIVKINDILTIRGKGKFKIISESYNNKKTKKLVELKKYA